MNKNIIIRNFKYNKIDLDKMDCSSSREKRIRNFIQSIPHFQGKDFFLIENFFSTRLFHWVEKSETEQWCSNIFEDCDRFYREDENDGIIFLDNREDIVTANKNDVFLLFSSPNKIVKLEDGVYFLSYKESLYNRAYTFEGIVFVNESGMKWDDDSEKVKEFIVRFSHKLKKFYDRVIEEKRKKDAFNSIFLPEEIMSDIRNEFETFVKSKDLYKNELKLPWKRGIMFIGPPGNGKTSLIRAICNYYSFETIDIKDAIRNNGDVDLSDEMDKEYGVDMELYPNDELPRVCIMEDIDKMTNFQSGSHDHVDSGKITLHDLLKGLDGFKKVNDLIMIATTNFAEVINEALVNRPGRFDKIYRIELPKKREIERFINYHKMVIGSKEESEQNVRNLAGKLESYSMAFTEEYIKQAKMKYRRCNISLDESDSIYQKIKKHNDDYKSHFTGDDKKSFGFGMGK